MQHPVIVSIFRLPPARCHIERRISRNTAWIREPACKIAPDVSRVLFAWHARPAAMDMANEGITVSRWAIPRDQARTRSLGVWSCLLV